MITKIDRNEWEDQVLRTRKKRWKKRAGIFLSAVALLLTAGGCGGNQEAREKYETGLQAISDEKYKEAEKDLLAAVQEKEGKSEEKLNKKAYYALGVTASRQGEYEEAISYFKKALKIDVLKDFNPDIYAYCADAYQEQGHYKKALSQIKKARETKEKDMDLLLKEYYLLEETGQDSEAEDLLNEGLNYKGAGDEFSYKQARLYYYIGNMKQARVQMEKAAEKGYVGAYIYLGMISEKEEDYDTALSMYEKCRKQLKNEGNIPGFLYSKLVKSYMDKGNYERALKRLKEASEIGDGTFAKELKKDEIAILEQNADFEGAYKVAKEYLKMDPDDKEVKREVQFLETRVKSEENKK